MAHRKIYRAISMDEWLDWTESGIFRCGTNTLEAKQFFESIEAVKNFVYLAGSRNFQPPYIYILEIEIDKKCLEGIQYDTMELDRYEAISIAERSLEQFNKCNKQIKEYDI